MIQSFPPTVRSALTIDKDALAAVKRGMRAVVSDSDGTGTRASNNYVAISGKTGTGQWKPAKSQNIAWFAGFAPSEAPVYAFAAVYEGQPGEKIGGGSKAAPIIGDFFQEYLTEPRLFALQEFSRGVTEREPGVPLPSDDPSLSAIFYDAPSVDPLAGMTPPPEQRRPAPVQPFFKGWFGGGKKGGR
jgi:penicillin-binding protein 2